MAFQFMCPQGHLLEGDPSQSGQQITCPVCQQLFIIPAAPESTQPAVEAPQAFTGPTFGPPSDHPAQQPFAPAPEPAGLGLPQVGPQRHVANPFESPDSKILHIPCPSCKKELETPPEMLDMDVMCPHCDAQFLLRERDSVESKRKRQDQIEQREYVVGQKWLSWSIAIAVLVLLFLAILIGISIMD